MSMARSDTVDSIGRRLRNRRLTSDKRITPQPRDLLWFQKIHEHGPLSSSFLHAFSAHLAKSEKRAKDRLTDLFNEDRTPHGGPYLIRPNQQFDTFDARYNLTVYDLDRAAEAALKERGMWHSFPRTHTGAWKHNYMVAAITASIELATLHWPNINYIPQHAVLERAKTDLRFPVSIQIPRTRKKREVDLIPDALFGLEYICNGTKTYRFFAVEADRGTEPTRASRFNRKSHLRSFLQYREYVGQKLYKEHLGLKSGLMVLNVTKDQVTHNRMMGMADELFERGNSYMLFSYVDAFTGYFKPVAPIADLLSSHWSRAGLPDFRIDQP
jgi:hypothetical protein